MDLTGLLNQMLAGQSQGQANQTTQQQTPALSQGAGSGLLTGAAAAGVMALLLGTKRGRSVAGAGVKLGSLAALGTLAYQMYNQWQKKDASADTSLLAAPAAQEPSLDSTAILKAMVAAAKADGHVDQQEIAAIRTKLAEFQLDEDVNSMLLKELTTPTNAQDVAALAKGDGKAAVELYLLSSMLVDPNNAAEKAYLADLQAALGLPDHAVQLS
ncbi:tellurite resistance TerB family protein [Thiolinea disciformis]|uniref:tellurite resistance TerB family protein n=1 Tax=Thiolinea disciformis TaxID=125614 RepID=UPI000369E297|nr:tellurite resistance TerB family protein [Thiolinea disciformis]